MRKFIALGAALLILTGCAGEAAEPASPATVEPTQEPEAESPKAPDLELDHPSAVGDYGPRWVAEFGLPKIRDFEVIGSPDTNYPEENTVSVTGIGLSMDSREDFSARLQGLGWTVVDNGVEYDQLWEMKIEGIRRLILISEDLDTDAAQIVYMEKPAQ